MGVTGISFIISAAGTVGGEFVRGRRKPKGMSLKRFLQLWESILGFKKEKRTTAGTVNAL